MKTTSIIKLFFFIISYSLIISCTSNSEKDEITEFLDRPTIKSVEIESNTIVITWDRVKNANGYEIYHSEDGKDYNLKETECKYNRYTDTLPSVGENYYKVRAISNKAKSEFSLPSSPIIYNNKIILKNDVETINVMGVSFKMIKVKSGSFNMGTDEDPHEDLKYNASPMHTVTLSEYYIGETEVTQELYQAIIGRNPSYFQGNQRPVETVSWNDCQNFITKLNEQTGLIFRLPTEAEWEYAAYGGHKIQEDEYWKKGYKLGMAWTYYNSNGRTHDVATRAPNDLACYDFTGNVDEWCQDWYSPYSSNPQTNPKGPSTGDSRIYRGGNYQAYGKWQEIYRRHKTNPKSSDETRGFRLAL